MKLMEMGKTPTTDEEAMQYLPDGTPLVKRCCVGLYHVYREQGCTIIDALQKVLETYLENAK